MDRRSYLPPPAITTVKRKRKPRLFTKDIESLLYAMGDGPVSLESTINALDDCLSEYLVDLSHKSLDVAKAYGRTRIKIDDLPLVLKNDPVKLARFNYIREQSLKIEMAKKMFDHDPAGGVDEEDDPNTKKLTKKQKKQLEQQGKKKKRKLADDDSDESDDY